MKKHLLEKQKDRITDIGRSRSSHQTLVGIIVKLDWFPLLHDLSIKLLKDLQVHGIEFISLTEQIDTTTPGGKLIFHLMGALAESAS